LVSKENRPFQCDQMSLWKNSQNVCSPGTFLT
jgi:hypothetical protein